MVSSKTALLQGSFSDISWVCRCVCPCEIYIVCVYEFYILCVCVYEICIHEYGPTFKIKVWNLTSLMIPIQITFLLPQYKERTVVWICTNQWCSSIPQLSSYTTFREKTAILIIWWVHTRPAHLQRPSKFLPELFQCNTLNHHICKARPYPENYLYSGTESKETAPIENIVALPPRFANPCHRHPISMHPYWNCTPPPLLTSPQGSVALPSPKICHCMCMEVYKMLWLWHCTCWISIHTHMHPHKHRYMWNFIHIHHLCHMICLCNCCRRVAFQLRIPFHVFPEFLDTVSPWTYELLKWLFVTRGHGRNKQMWQQHTLFKHVCCGSKGAT